MNQANMLIMPDAQGNELVNGSRPGCLLLCRGSSMLLKPMNGENSTEQAKRPNSPNAAARLRKLQADAEIAEMKAAQLAKSLKQISEMESLIAALATKHRDFLASFIARISPLIAGKCWEQSEVFQFLQELVRAELKGQEASTQSHQEPSSEPEGYRDSGDSQEVITEPPPPEPPPFDKS